MTTNQNPATTPAKAPAFDQDAMKSMAEATALRKAVEANHANNAGAVHVANMIYASMSAAESARSHIAYLAESLRGTMERIIDRAESGDYLGRSDANTDLLDSLQRELHQHDADLASARRLVAALNAIVTAA